LDEAVNPVFDQYPIWWWIQDFIFFMVEVERKFGFKIYQNENDPEPF
jgi:hypothetical protein